MISFKNTLLAGSLLLAFAGTAQAEAGCGIEKGTVSILGNDFPALHAVVDACLLYTSPSPRDRTRSRMPSSA